MLTEYESSGIHNTVQTAVKKSFSEHGYTFDELDIFEVLKKNNLGKAYEHCISSHVTFALTADMLHYLYEALRCFEKRKFSVGFSLLRKPLKEHLLYLSWLLADKDDFITRFEANNYETLNNVSKDRRLEIFRLSIDKLATDNAFNAELIWDIIYSKSHPNGFEPTCQRATHLITSMGSLLRTEDYSFNFIFEDHSDNGHCEFIYSKLPYVLIYLVQTLLARFNRISALNSLTYSHLIITTMGCYEALFIDGRSQHIGRMLNRELGELLKCPHCKTQIKISRANAASVYLQEQAQCKECGLIASLPLYWLLGQASVKIVPK